MQQELQKRQESAQEGGSSLNLSSQDRQNIQQLFEMFGAERSRQFIENFYVARDKKMEVVLDLFLSGSIPEEKEDLRVIIEDQGRDKSTAHQKIDTTYG
jgi:dsDNA-specific endonuclease/ATPase MutS2